LYTEEQQRRDRKSGRSAEVGGGSPAVTINVLPGHAQSASSSSRQPRSVGAVQVWDSSLDDDLIIEGPRDVAVRGFSEWLQAQYQDPSHKEEVQKAEKALLDEGFGLLQIYGGRNADFLASKGVKRGVADSFMNDIPLWNKRQKTKRLEAGDGLDEGF
jgi:hypothetical protein